MKTKPSILFIILLLALSGLLWRVNSVWGQSNIHLSSVQIGLLPEYNQPDMLVVLEVELSDSPTQPATLTFQVPAEAESLNVFERSSDGEKISLSYEASEDGFWEEIRFSTEARIIQIEYTDPNIVKLEDRRFYDFRWLSIYPVETLTLTARQPFGAGEIHTEPELEDTETGPDEAMYSTGKFGPISAEELFSLNLTYVKNTSNLAYPALEVEPAVPVTDATPGRTSSPLSVVMWLFTVAVAVILLVGLYYWWFKSNVMEKQDRIVQGVGIMNPEKQAVFCHECGMRSRPVDSYCSNCGTELRRPT